MPAGASDAELAAAAGCNLFTQAPEIKNWLVATLAALAPVSAVVTMGAYAYLDGELHVRVSLAMDAIMAGVAAARKVWLVRRGVFRRAYQIKCYRRRARAWRTCARRRMSL